MSPKCDGIIPIFISDSKKFDPLFLIPRERLMNTESDLGYAFRSNPLNDKDIDQALDSLREIYRTICTPNPNEFGWRL
jgi:hypothetical protein